LNERADELARQGMAPFLKKQSGGRAAFREDGR